MPAQKTTDLTALTSPVPEDITYIVDDVAGTPVSRKITLADLARGFRTIVCSGQSLTGSQADSLVSLAATWNTTGTPTAFSLNITDTASDANSLLARFQVGGVNLFDFTKARAFRLYNTTDAGLTNFERGFMRWNSNIFDIGYEAGGTGVVDRVVRITTRSQFQVWNTQFGYSMFSTTSSGLIQFGSAITGPFNGSSGTYFGLIEMTAPAAPDTNGVRIYAEDDGSGKTRLMARFATGAAVQIAIEP